MAEPHYYTASPIVQEIIAAFKRQMGELFKQAEAMPGTDLVDVCFETDLYLVCATFHQVDKLFVKLVASPLHEVPDDLPAVVFTISPPEAETWGATA